MEGEIQSSSCLADILRHLYGKLFWFSDQDALNTRIILQI